MKEKYSNKYMFFRIEEIYGNTVQGEGYWSGVYCDFVRLFGCPVGCEFCDQGYFEGNAKSEFRKMSIPEILSELSTAKRVILTGGEPLIQKNVYHLIIALKEYGRRVNIETSGAKWVSLPEDVWVTLSPKEHLNSNYLIDKKWWKRANEIKLVISDGDELTCYDEIYRTKKKVYLQPEWNHRHEILPIILNLLEQNQHFRLSQQTHKFANLP